MAENSSDVEADALRAGIVGLGAIGGGVAVSMVRRGRLPSVFDVRPDAADGLDGVPAPQHSPGDVARDSDVVLVAVVNAAQARDVLAGPDGILAASRPGLIVVLLSTVSLEDVRELAELCAAGGATLLDCGVTRGDEAAKHGIVAMIGGPDDAVAKAWPVLEDFARAVVHCGPLGAGMTVKIARNLITYGVWAVVDEAANLARANNVSLQTLLEVLEAADSDAGPQTLRLLKVRAAGIKVPPDYAEQVEMLAGKDLDAAASLGQELGVSTPLALAVKPLMRDVYTGHR
ncbi:NAD(P)-dependent oxidoreductase [Mycobacterium sp.]|uniref:NAD(P)-dependent oxidoreductase n=1 Tax=Mycobacterium sp. TaxID=1785 RepID=UPI002CD92C41|nr:NAD(P)-dependent oxidoreductase [Mycobacterium sp.]HTQ16639.1 NAD(P)-dependent oxidoreductase [Mycobacterium sp.]